MPEVEDLKNEAVSQAWQLQRALDRTKEIKFQKDEEDVDIAKEEKLHTTSDWFFDIQGKLKEIVNPYLGQ